MMKQSIAQLRKLAITLCKGAASLKSWKIADDKVWKFTGCGCKELGVNKPERDLK